MTSFQLVISSILVACCWGSPYREGKIVGGEDADISQFPYQLQLELFGSLACGASVISRDWAVTAAHCVQWVRADSMTLRAGSTIRDKGGKVYSVAEAIAHPRYTDLDYDIALLKVSEPFKFGANVQPIGLPVEHQRVAQGAHAVVSGWGYLRSGSGKPSNILQSVMVPIVDQHTCEECYDYDSKTISGRMICAGLPAGGKDACQGDSGGPMAVNGTLTGIVSWGKGCALPEFPGVYTRVSELRGWIRETSGV